MKISQREARRLQQRVRQLEDVLEAQKRVWIRDWPLGVHLTTISVDAVTEAVFTTARKLKHAVVCTQVNGGKLELYACEL